MHALLMHCSLTLPHLSKCMGFGAKCIIDLNSAPNPLFLIGTNALLSGACTSALHCRLSQPMLCQPYCS